MLVPEIGTLPRKQKKKLELELAESYFINFLKERPWFYIKYQVMWLKAVHWRYLSNELSGSLHPHLVSSSAYDATNLLYKLSDRKARKIVLPKKGVAISESTISFSDFSVSFMPGGKPCLMYRGRAPMFLSELFPKLPRKEAADNLILKIWRQ
jgi:hypothetical protein